MIIKAVPIIAKSHHNFLITIVGAQNDDEMEFLQNMVSKEHAEQFVQCKKWTDNPTFYYENACMFVLLADLLYLNFSLIEAMERGVPPIIANVEDADKIVTDGYDGLLCSQNEHDLAKKIIYLLDNPSARESMGRNAREKVDKHFNHRDRMLPIVKFLSYYYQSVEIG